MCGSHSSLQESSLADFLFYVYCFTVQSLCFFPGLNVCRPLFSGGCGLSKVEMYTLGEVDRTHGPGVQVRNHGG